MKKIITWNSFVHNCVHDYRKEEKKHVEMCSKSNVDKKLPCSDVISVIKCTTFIKGLNAL